MTTCRVCAAIDGEPALQPDPRAAGTGGAALLLRVWHEDDVRARLIGVDPPYRTVATAQGIDGVCDAVRAWLTRL